MDPLMDQASRYPRGVRGAGRIDVLWNDALSLSFSNAVFEHSM